jgi:hypothetical protein
MDQIYQYELEHRIRLPIHSLLAVSVREIIMAEIGQSVTEQRFYSIPREEVFAAIREHVKPRSKPAFAQALKRKIDLDWPNNFELSPTNFKVAYERYLIYRNKFMKRYDFMRENNSQNIPECRDNDDGLIGIFLKGLNNFSYPKTAYGRIPHDTKKTFRGEDGFQTFIDVYYTHIKDDYEKYKSARELLENMKPEKVRPSAERKDLERWATLPLKRPEGPKQQFGKPKSLYFLDSDPLNEAGEDSDNDSKDFDEVEIDHRETALSQDEQSLGYGAEETQIHALSNNKESYPCCFQKLFHDTCTRQNCTYPHTREALVKGFLHYADCLKKSPLRPPGFIIGYAKEPDKPVPNTSQQKETTPKIMRKLQALAAEPGSDT